MRKSFYILGGMLAASLFTACSDENVKPATESVAVAETPVVQETLQDAPATTSASVLDTAITDLREAIDLAKKEDRLILVEFTGSDWCPPCKLLRSNILSKPEFSKYVGDRNIIFVELDFPRTPGKIPADVMREREGIMNFYGVRGFPSVLLLDKNGAAYAKIVGVTKTIPEYLEKLETAYLLCGEFSAAVKAAQQKTGAERLEALVNALNALPTEFQALQKELVAQIIAEDTNDRFGFKAKEREARLGVEQREMLMQFADKHRGKRNPDEARVEALELLKNDELLPITKCELNKYISDGYAMQGKLPEALNYLKAARDCVAGTKRATELDRWVKQIETIIAQQEAKKAGLNLPQTDAPAVDAKPVAK